jgi:hypothetical protein
MPNGMRFGGQVGLSPGSERKIMEGLGKALKIGSPWLAWPLVAAVSTLMYFVWPANIAVIAFFIITGVVMSLFYMRVSKSQSMGSRLHVAGIILISALIVPYISVVGFTSPVIFILAVAYPLIVCMSWSMRVYADMEKKLIGGDLDEIFEKAGLGQTRMQINWPTPGGLVKKLRGHIQMPGSERTVEDLAKRAANVEGGLNWPKGTLTIMQNANDASIADITVSDPRILDNPYDWPGPSAVGASIAVPLQVGVWQDGEMVDLTILENHVQIMGMTGAGKSLGACWDTMAELITRNDVAIFAADITKGSATLGPIADSLTRFETTIDGAKQMLVDVHSSIRVRQNYLTEKGLQKWEEGCGLTYLVVWLEECPSILDSLGKVGLKRWIESMRAARSAGISFVMSMQRSTWDQLPTLARGQMARWCFGVAQKSDAQYGLSEMQLKAKVNPAEWGRRYPGKAYLDAPGIDEDRITMPMRTFYWGKTDELIRKYAKKYTQKVKLDWVTEEAMQQTGTDITQVADNTKGPIDVDKPDPVVVELPKVIAAEPVLSGNARKDLRKEIENNYMYRSFTIADLTPFCEVVNRGRTWLYAALAELCKADFLEREEETEVATWHVIPETDLKRAKAFLTGSAARAEKYKAPVDKSLTPEMLLPLYEAEHCHYCQKPLGDKRQIDHKVPLSRGGAHALENMAPACPSCNESKGHMTEDEFRERMRF